MGKDREGKRERGGRETWYVWTGLLGMHYGYGVSHRSNYAMVCRLIDYTEYIKELFFDKRIKV